MYFFGIQPFIRLFWTVMSDINMFQGIFFRRFFYAGIVVFWVVTMSMLLLKHYGPPAKSSFTGLSGVIPERLYREQWMGVYQKGGKIGYALRKITPVYDGYKISEMLKMNIKVMGADKTIETSTDAYIDEDLKLKSFDFILKSDISMGLKGVVNGNNITVSVESQGRKSEHKMTLKESPYLNLTLIPGILRNGIKPGAKMTVPVIDPATLTQDSIDIDVGGKEPVIAMGQRQEAYRLRGLFRGIEIFMWVNEDGEVLREETPLGFTLVKETMENAMQEGRPSLDLIEQVSVPFDLRLPVDTGYLKVRLSGVDFKWLELSGGNQVLRGDVLEVRKEVLVQGIKIQDIKAPYEYLADTVHIQSRDPQIVSLSKELVKGEKDAVKAARLLYDWVYRNIMKVPAITIPMATEVLKSKKGDCNEHTILFIALARAAGIPSRAAIGLAYKEGFFYYHAWPEVYLNKWVAVDPTLGGFPADASRIRLVTGDMDKQTQILSVIGKIKIEGMEYH